ncbi:hypothetical protein L3Q82_000215 [Scortum barcoo]|uniref:Uncharacterized protein n=1 Tax=Scortum barcoo TaxID=214431 RepID=A0ACB8X9H8_9TELE|nr:hypothetical protein L3Q82_000215 [Scortum barcoo]
MLQPEAGRRSAAATVSFSPRIMLSHMSVCASPMLQKANLAVWRAWRSWKLSLHSSTVCASSGPGPLDRSEEQSLAEKPPHTPVMLKEVLHYLDIQQETFVAKCPAASHTGRLAVNVYADRDVCSRECLLSFIWGGQRELEGLNSTIRHTIASRTGLSLAGLKKGKSIKLEASIQFVMAFLVTEWVVLDMTFGGGGHTKAILNMAPEVTVLALDRDPTAVSLAEQLAKEHSFWRYYRYIRDRMQLQTVVHYSSGCVKPLLGRFSELEALLSNMNIKPGSIDAVLLDAGCSSMQMDKAERGFSISKDGPLDMRMDGERYPDMPCAADVVNTLDQQALASILTAYGEERHARKIASAIVEARRVNPITRTQQLASVVAGSFPAAVVYARKDRLHRPAHVATKTFQALRIFVNDELNELHAGLRAARAALRPGGRLCVITFHSLEDRLVKRFLQRDYLSNLDEYHFSSRKQERLVDEKRDGGSAYWLPLRRKVITPEKDDVKENPRGRSAKLRAALRR